MSGTTVAVTLAYLLGLPVLLGLLGVTAHRRGDRVLAGLILAVCLGFAVYAARAATGPYPPGPRMDPAFLGLWLAGAIGLGVRLIRDRRLRHVRSTLESLAVLGSGTILLAVLLWVPRIYVELARARGG